MQPDRSNYEIWFIDWLDGKLSDYQIELLRRFLDENRDLKEEFDDFGNMAIPARPAQDFNIKNSLGIKEHLKKNPADLTLSQIEYLSVAYLENDLSATQEAELREAIGSDPVKKKTFEAIQKTKLNPEPLVYKHKRQLVKITSFQKVVRLSISLMSAAAIIALVLLINPLRHNTIQVRSDKTSQVVPQEPEKKQVDEAPTKQITKEPEAITARHVNRTLAVALQKSIPEPGETDITPGVKNDTVSDTSASTRTLLNKIRIPTAINLNAENVHPELIALNMVTPAQLEEDDRPRLGRFIAKTFRERILKEKTAKDTPLKVYEIAEAGVTGLNRLLGWEMALDEKSDADGRPRSVYFSSKLLKFNAPIKK